MGEEPRVAAGHHGRVAEGAGDVAVLGADLQLSGYHGTDAGGGPPVHGRRQDVERCDDAGRV